MAPAKRVFAGPKLNLDGGTLQLEAGSDRIGQITAVSGRYRVDAISVDNHQRWVFPALMGKFEPNRPPIGTWRRARLDRALEDAIKFRCS